jgi:hypothetical protein
MIMTAVWQLTCPASCLLRTVTLEVLSSQAAAPCVESLGPMQEPC